MSELKLQNRVMPYLRKHLKDAWIVKISDRVVGGIPDILFVAQGQLYAIELKVGKNKPTKLQKYTMKIMEKAGAKTAVCYTFEAVQNKLLEWELIA